jgi:hypothetical protein
MKLRALRTFQFQFQYRNLCRRALEHGASPARNPRWLSASPHSPRARARISSGRAKQEMPAQAPARQPVARRLLLVRDESGDEKPTHSSEISASALREAAAPSAPGAPSARPSARRTTERSRLAVRRRRSLSSRRTRRKFAERFSISEDVAAQPPSPSRPRAECWQCSGVAVDQTAAYRERSEIYGDASQMQSPWKAPSSPK